MQTLSAERSRAIMEAAQDDRLEGLYVLALTTGMRQGELLALRWRDADLERGAVHVRGSLKRVRAASPSSSRRPPNHGGR